MLFDTLIVQLAIIRSISDDINYMIGGVVKFNHQYKE